MWNRRKDEDFALKPASAPPTPSALAKEGIPMSTLPGRMNEPHFDNPRGGSAVLGKSVIVKGHFQPRGSDHRRRSRGHRRIAGAPPHRSAPMAKCWPGSRLAKLSSCSGRFMATSRPPTKSTSARTRSWWAISRRLAWSSRMARISKATSTSCAPKSRSLSRRRNRNR